jgi:hypothetical protein
MKFTFKENPDQVELIKAMGSKDAKISRDAQEMLAAFITPIAQEVIRQAGTASLIFTDKPYNEDDSASIPLDLYFDEGVGYITAWSQSIPGGIPTNHVESIKEMKVATYRIDSAVSFLKRYARRGRLDVVAKAVERMLQEVLVKQERNAWAVILKALAEARTQGLYHVITNASETSLFTMDSLNKLMTRMRRIAASFANGTAEFQDSRGLTDLFVSPEVKEQIRAFVYQPMNTTALQAGTPSNVYGPAVALPDAARMDIWRNSNQLFDVSITEMIEFGSSRKYNFIFDEFAGADTTFGYSGEFDNAADEIVVGLDLSREAFLRPIARNADTGATFTAIPDDQFAARSEKVGFYGALEEGRVIIDSRAVVGISI